MDLNVHPSVEVAMVINAAMDWQSIGSIIFFFSIRIDQLSLKCLVVIFSIIFGSKLLTGTFMITSKTFV